MFPHQIMDNYLKLKLELAYRDLAIEPARQVFEQLKQTPEEVEAPLNVPKTITKKRKRIPAKK
jgi:hypothetical protein